MAFDRPSVSDRLDAERQRLAAQVEALTRDFDEIVEASALVAADDEHDPDGSTIAFERAPGRGPAATGSGRLGCAR